MILFIESSTSNDVLFVGVARLLKKRTITELSLLEANKNEYFTRHLVDGRIIFCDHRISLVAGYMAEEVSGTSAFKFMYKDDVRWTIIALRHSKKPRIYYFLFCKTIILFKKQIFLQCMIKAKIMVPLVIDLKQKQENSFILELMVI